MNYETAKKLKDAGFPQGDDLYCKCAFLSDKEQGKQDVTYDCHTEKVANPTLSELIEACGEYFGALVRVKNVWKAVAIGRTMDDLTLPSQECEGTTPEEAVANLYLALNK